ncbi:MAG TPA: PH domain-containing protein, partial [Planctomycetota bacterium]|nr:PH domain-containing protein [Planctomycetota bacterium]
GILFVEERAVPVKRMQHIDLVRGPIERLFGLATLVVYTAGNEGSAFRVPGLKASRAQELRDLIVQARGDGRL